MAEDVRVLWAYSIQGKCRLQEEGLLMVTQRRAASKFWFSGSVCLIDWGWSPELNETLAWRDWGARSDTTSEGIPCRRKTLVRGLRFQLLRGSLGRGMK